MWANGRRSFPQSPAARGGRLEEPRGLRWGLRVPRAQAHRGRERLSGVEGPVPGAEVCAAFIAADDDGVSPSARRGSAPVHSQGSLLGSWRCDHFSSRQLVRARAQLAHSGTLTRSAIDRVCPVEDTCLHDALARAFALGAVVASLAPRAGR